jgi:RNA polymerase sigma factor (sigma-70 family)
MTSGFTLQNVLLDLYRINATIRQRPGRSVGGWSVWAPRATVHRARGGHEPGNRREAVVRCQGVGTQRLDFAEFYRGSKDECLFTVLLSVGDQDTAQDLVAEAFARAWASWRTVSRHPAPTAWVVRTALNANISRWRRRRREVSVPNPGAVTELPVVGGAADSSVDPRIMAALMRLPVRQRQVVALRLFLDLDTGRTGEVLGIAPGTVQSHLGRAIAALRADLIPERQEESPS